MAARLGIEAPAPEAIGRIKLDGDRL